MKNLLTKKMQSKLYKMFKMNREEQIRRAAINRYGDNPNF